MILTIENGLKFGAQMRAREICLQLSALAGTDAWIVHGNALQHELREIVFADTGLTLCEVPWGRHENWFTEFMLAVDRTRRET